MKERISEIPLASSPAQSTKPLTDEQLQDNDFLRSMAKGKLAQIIHENPATPGLVTAINALLDRIDGKPAQIIHQTNETTINLAVNERRERARQEVKAALEQALLIDVTPSQIEK